MSRETDLAWAAGFIDGEGCFSNTRSKRTKLPTGVRLTVGQNDPEVLYKLQSILGGIVNGPYQRPDDGFSSNPRYDYSLCYSKLTPQIEALWEHLGKKKRRQYNAAIDRITKAA